MRQLFFGGGDQWSRFYKNGTCSVKVSAALGRGRLAERKEVGWNEMKRKEGRKGGRKKVR